MADDKIVTDDIEEKDDIEKDDLESEENEDQEEDDEQDVPVRNATLQHIIARKNKKIAKLESKEEEDESSLTPEAEEALDKKIEDRLSPIREAEIQRETDSLLSGLYSEEPEAKNYDKVIRRFMDFEKNGVKPYQHVPPEVIFHHLAFGKAEASGAEKRANADKAARLSGTRGRSNRPKSARTNESGLPSIEEMESMSDADFTAKVIAPSLQG